MQRASRGELHKGETRAARGPYYFKRDQTSQIHVAIGISAASRVEKERLIIHEMMDRRLISICRAFSLWEATMQQILRYFLLYIFH